MKTIFLIPAKEISHRIKNKNLKKIGSKTLLQIKIENALKANCGSVFVSTESRKIANLARKYGALVPFLRNKKYSSKSASSISFVLDFLRSYKEFYKIKNNVNICILPVTNPFLKSETIKKCVRMKNKNKNINSLTSIVKSQIHPYQFIEKTKKKIKFNLFRYKKNKYLNFEQTQSWPNAYISSPSIRITNINFFLKKINNLNPNFSSKMIDLKSCIGHEISVKESMDINDQEDYKMAQKTYDLYKKK